MRRLALLAALAPAVALAPGLQDTWVPLFNGRDLAGWTPKITGLPLGEDPLRTFRVADGAIQVRYDGYDAFGGRFGHLFWRTPYSHYVLRMEVRFVGEQAKDGPGWAWRNSGVMIHGQSAESMAVGQEFPVSAEVQFLGGPEDGERTTGNLCTPGTNVVMGGELVTRHCTDSTSPTYRGDGWVRMEVEVHGDGEVVHRVEGKEVMRYSAVQSDPTDADARRIYGEKPVVIGKGTVSLQAESHPVDFRKVEIMVIE
jgi:hypothetical protein